ncbi:hypothetical protein pRL70184 (plasmid) [Rhizobium johnstonii 3841]|uniref:Uncharacterized protein n=1 Tax=Rhizobium johnstonii (strain DSM 114642 / LMG 32736 / 3841) TaxID=216596 RepID=Q1M9L2_RHIJ3|nr:hypothetical protein pRL70184 [Rhizobium johnstonii 3841]
MTAMGEKRRSEHRDTVSGLGPTTDSPVLGHLPWKQARRLSANGLAQPNADITIQML